MIADPGLPFESDSPWLAPLAGFSDLPFRLLCREQGCAAACTEMVSAKGLLYGNQGTKRLLATHPLDRPLVVQLYGPEPQSVGLAMEILLTRGHRYFDLNAGCSVPKVVKTGSGAALLRTPENLVRIVGRMVEICGAGNVGVKMRLGWKAGEGDLQDLGRRLEDAGAGWLTLHPRWAVQGFSGSARWDCLRDLRTAVAVPVIASGDLFTAEDACRCLDSTGVDAVMFARGALWDPSIFGKFLALRGRPGPEVSASGHCLALARRHMLLSRELLPDHRALLVMRTIVPRYLRSLPGVRELRRRMTTLTSWEELEDLLGELEA